MRRWVPMRHFPARRLAAALLAALPGACAGAAAGPVSPATAPARLIRELAALPEPGLKAVRLRAAVSTSVLSESAYLALTIGARGASIRIHPSPDPSGTVVERVVWPARIKPWTPAKPVIYQLEAVLETRGRRPERKTLRFPIRSIEVREGRVFLNGAKLAVRGADGLSGTVLEPCLSRLHSLGYNLVRLGAAARDPAAREACDAHGLLVYEDLPSPPALSAFDAEPPAAPDAAALESVGLLEPFGTATAFAEACRAQRAESARRSMEDVRFDPESAGYLVAGWNALGDGAKRVHAPWLLAARLSRGLVETGTAPLVTLLVAGPAPLPRDLAVEWRLLESPGCCPACRTATGAERSPRKPSVPPWRPAPKAVAGVAGAFGAAGAFGGTAAPGASSSEAFALPAVETGGYWTFEARARRGSRILSSTREGFGAMAEPAVSQISFALLGDAPELGRAFGSWIIPGEYAGVTVVVHPARVGAEAVAALAARVAGGKRAVFLALDADDINALNQARAFGFTLTATGTPGIGWFRPGPLSARSPRPRGAQPAAGEVPPPRWLADEADAPLSPETELAPLPGATVWAGSLRPDGPEGAWSAAVQSVAAGSGRVVFCQMRLLEHFDQILAKLTFLRLLAL